jgi:hypothetical protein
VRVTAADKGATTPPELEQRVARIEASIDELRKTVDTAIKRTIALQAHIDFLNARVRGV